MEEYWCPCMHMCLHTCIHISLHTCPHIRLHMCPWTCLHICLYTSKSKMKAIIGSRFPVRNITFGMAVYGCAGSPVACPVRGYKPATTASNRLGKSSPTGHGTCPAYVYTRTSAHPCGTQVPARRRHRVRTVSKVAQAVECHQPCSKVARRLLVWHVLRTNVAPSQCGPLCQGPWAMGHECHAG